MLSLPKSKKHTILILLFIVILSLPAIFPLLKPGFFQTDDGDWMIIRFSAFHQALRDGQLPVRWLGRLNFDYGYPVANFLYPGFMYLAEIPKLLGFSFSNSIKIIISISMLMSGIFTYMWLSKVFSRFSGFLGSVLYVYFPYHLYDVYKRGSVGETLALGIVPCVLWLLDQRKFYLLSLFVALLVLSHNTLAILFLPTICIYAVIKYFNDKQLLLLSGISIFFGILIASFFWIPAILEIKYTIFLSTAVSSWQNYFAGQELIGVGSVCILIIAVFVLFQRQQMKLKDENTSLSLFFLLSAVLSIFLSLSLSFWVWEFLPVSFVQFPFRFLSVTAVSIAYLAAYAYTALAYRYKKLFTVFLFCIFVITFIFYVNPNQVFREDTFYSTNDATTTVQNEYMPYWVREFPTKRPNKKVELLQGINTIKLLSSTTNKTIIETNGQEALIRVNTIYYPGWKAYIDNTRVDVSYNNPKGVMDIVVPQGKHMIQLFFGETYIRLISDFLSVVSFITISLLSLKKKLLYV